MDEKERLIRQRLKDDFEHYALKCLKIRTKDGSIEPFKLNKAQRYIHQKLQDQLRTTGKVRAIILKGRQQGCSTYIGARLYHKVTHSRGVQAFILTHALDATNNLFKMSKRFYENTPPLVRPEITLSNSKELVFGRLDSGYKIGTAENKNVGRSSTIQLAHFSECGFWSNASDHATGIMQAIPNGDNTEIILESTANGVGNYLHQEWQKAEAGISEFQAIFIPWYWQDEYRLRLPEHFTCTPEEAELKSYYKLDDEQINWRRNKIVDLSVNGMDGAKAFKQEYPFHAEEAFQLTGEDSYIPSDVVMRARKCQIAEPYGPIILGVDPARFGDDRTAIIRRQGRVAYGLESYVKRDTMEVAGLVHTIIMRERPALVCIDVGGLGAGVVDRLNELGHRDIVVGINAGTTALDGAKYSNKRAEMWGLLYEWLKEEPVQIPDIDSLHADICGVRYRFDSNSRLLMEQKADMKRRGVRSSDEADALCLTLAVPDTALQAQNKSNHKAKSLADTFQRQLNARIKLRTNT